MTTIESYKEYLTNQSLSLNTIEVYSSNVKTYLNFANSLPSRNSAQLYKEHLKQTSHRATSINLILTSIKNYCAYKNIPDVIRSEDFIKIQKKSFSPSVINESKIIKILDKIKLNESSRDNAIVSIMYYAGVRVSEALDIKLNDLDLINNSCIITGKGEKEREILIDNKTAKIINGYLLTRSKYKYASTSPYLFVSQMGNQLVRRTVNGILSKYKVSPHKWRHQFALTAIKAKIDGGYGFTINELATQLGHSDIKTTMVYLCPDKKSVLDKMNSRKVS